MLDHFGKKGGNPRYKLINSHILLHASKVCSDARTKSIKKQMATVLDESYLSSHVNLVVPMPDSVEDLIEDAEKETYFVEAVLKDREFIIKENRELFIKLHVMHKSFKKVNKFSNVNFYPLELL